MSSNRSDDRSDDRIRAALRKAGVQDVQGLERAASLYETAGMDSFVMLEVLTALEAEFGITIDNRDVCPENLDSIQGIAAFVARKQAGPA
jgi:acyl carrier protein